MMPPQTACLFPGQGSQSQLMRDLVEEICPDLLDDAMAEVGADPFERLGEGTRFVQPAVYCVDIAIWEATKHRYSPQAFAGHSLGELVALVAADSLSVEDGLRLVALRGRVTHLAASRVEGGMVAVMASRETAAPLADEFGVSLAGDNSPDQTVLSGSLEELEPVIAELRRRGVKATRLNVAGPFHSRWMVEAAEEFAAALGEVDFKTPRIPVYSCVTAMIFDDIRSRLVESLTSTVRWREIVENLHVSGIDHFVEMGAGEAMIGLAKRSLAGSGDGLRFEPAMPTMDDLATLAGEASRPETT